MKKNRKVFSILLVLLLTLSLMQPAMSARVWAADGDTNEPAAVTEPVGSDTTEGDEPAFEPSTQADPAPGAANSISMLYDDRLAVSTLGQSGAPVISDEVVTSFKVGGTVEDDAVVVYNSGNLIAVGTGTATLTWGEEVYELTVSPAPLTLLMVTGHSLGAGQSGNAAGSVLCETGTAYSTKSGTSLTTAMGLGYGSVTRPANIDAFTTGSGAVGNDAAIAYEYHKLTGDKVWVLNSAVGGTSLSGWKAGGSNYNAGVTLYTNAEKIVKNEIAAGHFTLGHLGIVNHTTANGDQTWGIDEYTTAFNSMWNGFKSAFAMDLDGDGATETVDCIALLPIWNVCAMNAWSNLKENPLEFNNGKLVNYHMSAFGTNGVIMGSTVGREWVSDAKVADYFSTHDVTDFYTATHNGSFPTDPATMQNGVYGDGVHYNQLGYNIQGVEVAESMYEYWYGQNSVTSVTLIGQDGYTEISSTEDNPIVMGRNATLVVAPIAEPSSAKLSFSIEGGITYENCTVTAKEVGPAKLTIKSASGTTLKEVYFDISTSAAPVLPANWYIWQFDDNGYTTTYGSAENTLSSVEGTHTITDGVLTDEKGVQKMSKPITIDPNKNWCVEIRAAKIDGVTMGCALSSKPTLGSSSISFWLSSDNPCFTIYKGSGYNFYMVSNEDYKKIAGLNFNEMHTYRFSNIEGTVYLFVDGEEVGPLTYYRTSGSTRDSNVKEATGANALTYSRNTIEYVGANGMEGWKSSANYDYIALYDDAATLTLNTGIEHTGAEIVEYIWPYVPVTLPAGDSGSYNFMFNGWNEKADGSGTTYAAGDSYTITSYSNDTLYGMWDTDGNYHRITFENSAIYDIISVEGQYIVANGEDFEFTLHLADEYDEGEDFAVTANGSVLTPDAHGTYVIHNVLTDQYIEITGIEFVGDKLEYALLNTVKVCKSSNFKETTSALTLLHGDVDLADDDKSLVITEGKLKMASVTEFSMDKNWVIEFTIERDPSGAKQFPVLVDTTADGNIAPTTGQTSIWRCSDGSLRLVRVEVGSAFYWHGIKNPNMPADFVADAKHTYRMINDNGQIGYYVDGDFWGYLDMYTVGGTSGTVYSQVPNFNFNIGYVGAENKVTASNWFLFATVSDIILAEDTAVVHFDTGATDLFEDETWLLPSDSITLPALTSGDGEMTCWYDAAEDKSYYSGSEYNPTRAGVITFTCEVQKILVDSLDSYTIPTALENFGYTTVDEIKSAMLETVAATNKFTEDNTVFYDVELYVSPDGGNTWVVATKSNFPSDGKLLVKLPYPEGTNKNGYDFFVTHLITTEMNGHEVGDIETPAVTKTDDGLEFYVTGLSPISVSFVKLAATDSGSTSTIPATMDSTNNTLFMSLMVASGLLLAAVIFLKKRDCE